VIVADDVHTASQTALTWLMAAVCLSGGRAALWASRARAISRGEGRPTLIVGAGRIGNLVARRLMQRPEFGLTPVGFLDNDPMELNGQRAPLPVLGASWDLEEVIRDHGVEHVIFTFSTAPHNVLLGMVRRCQAVAVSTSLVPRLFEVAVERVSVEHIGGLPLFAMRPADPKGWQFNVKYTIDRVVAAFLLLLISPLLATIAIAVRISVGNPIFFRQRRIGLDGRAFDMLKFRTMKHATEAGESKGDVTLASDTAPGGVEGEDRRTRVGKFLRATSLDELPQIINVLLGQMSMVGPRPERPEFVELFREDVHRYSDRHRVKSGITGWARPRYLTGPSGTTTTSRTGPCGSTSRLPS
jgi:exopolysaccharide biosynthesis polyprenyl glycosylphosphotransferase